jgi:alpha-beta hydrolase superfamily lysophospholipase
MTFVEETVTAADGLRLYVRRHEVEHSRGQVLIVHGFGEHSGRYAALTEHLIRHRYGVTAYDHRGHGLSDGLPGHVDRFDEYEDDLDRVLLSVRARGQSQEPFLLGHSMGGLIVLRYLAKERKPIAAAVVSAPLIEVAVRVPAHKMMIARVGARVAPRLRLGNGIDPSVLSRDSEVGLAYAADPLVNRVVSTRWFTEATKAMEEIKQWAPRITVPLLVMHGTEDKLARVESTRALFEQLGSKEKELGIYQGYYHELFNEPEKQQIFDRVSTWLDKHGAGR